MTTKKVFDWKTADKDTVIKLAESIQKRGTGLQTDIHKTLMAGLKHAQSSGNITLFNKVVDHVPQMARRDAIGKWARQLDAIMVGKDGKRTVFKQSNAARLIDITDEQLDTLDSKPFYEVKTKSDTIATINVADRIKNLSKDIQNPTAQIKLDGALEELRVLHDALSTMVESKAEATLDA